MPDVARVVAGLGPGPVLDGGGAFGHLARGLVEGRGIAAVCLDVSGYAASRAVDPFHVQGSIVDLPFGPEVFGVVVTMDALEHLIPHDGAAAIEDITRVTRPGGWGLHLVGCHTDEHPEVNASDRTHLNPWPRPWYEETFRHYGMPVNWEATRRVNEDRAWAGTDWVGRWLVVRKP